MTRLCIILLVFVIPTCILAQVNLVNNPGFEEHKTCDFYFGAIETNQNFQTVVNSWISGNILGSPDYFNICHIPNTSGENFSIPLNSITYQSGHNLSNAYAGIAFGKYSEPYDFREYVQTKLKQKLEANKKYCVGLYTNLAIADSSINSADANLYASKDMGIYLNAERPFNPSTSASNPYTIETIPQIKADHFLNDTLNWELVSGEVMATGNEEWLTIGNFQPQFESNLELFYDNGIPFSLSYYVFDDVFVVPMEDGGILGRDTAVCQGGFPLTLQAESGNPDYTWSTGSTTQSIVVNAPGNYVVQSNYGGCLIRDTIHITEALEPPLTLPTIHLCESDLPAVFTLADSVQFNTITWATGATGRSITITDAGEWPVILKNNCYTLYDTLFVSNDTILQIDLGQDQSNCENGKNSMVTFTNIGVLPNYQWSNGSALAQITTDIPGIYVLTSSNACGVFSDSVILLSCPPLIYIPNTFKPASDNLQNIIFHPFLSNAKLRSMEIYNRWGELTYAAKGESIAWDGTYNGNDCPAGVYIYVVEYEQLSDGKVVQTSGDVLLVR